MITLSKKKIKYVALLAFLALLVVPFYAYAHYSVNGVYWENGSACYDTDRLNSSSYASAADTAANRWNNAGSNFNFNQEGFWDCGNDLSLEDMTTYEQQKGTDVTAVTFWTADSNDHFTEADIKFDSKESWTTDTSKDLDFTHTATHEFGHWLWLGDLSFSDASDHMMYYKYTGIDSLHADEKEGIKFIYGTLLMFRGGEYK